MRSSAATCSSPSRAVRARARQHLVGDVDASDLHTGWIERKRQTGADADLQNALARLAVHPVDGRLAAGLEQGAKIEIITFCVAPVDFLDDT